MKTVYLCYVGFPDDSGINDDSMMIFQTELEAELWKKMVNKTYRDDKPIIKSLEIEPKFGSKESN